MICSKSNIFETFMYVSEILFSLFRRHMLSSSPFKNHARGHSLRFSDLNEFAKPHFSIKNMKNKNFCSQSRVAIENFLVNRQFMPIFH